MNTPTIKHLSVVLLAGALSLGAAACGASDDGAETGTDAASGSGSEQPASSEVTVGDVWVREPADGQTSAAGYGTITNDSDQAVTLVGASAPISGTFEIHETSVDDEGVMSMAEKGGGFEIAAGESLTLEPGGPHVMMLDIDPSEFTGPIELTFEFDTIDVAVSAEIREIGAMDDMDAMGDADMDDADHSGDETTEMDMDEMNDGMNDGESTDDDG